MAKIVLGKWLGYKYVYVDKCPITELQDYIVLKLIQDLKCRLNSPKKPSINLASGHESALQREALYNEINGKEIDVTDKNNWCLKNNVLFLKLGILSGYREIYFMIANSSNMINKKEEIYEIIKDTLLYFDYNIDW